MDPSIDHLRYPIGTFTAPESCSSAQLDAWISVIEEFPNRLSMMVDELTAAELSWKYRPNGWSILQVIHHCADSHLNAFVRFKLALTEENPIIKPYDEARWAELADSKLSPDLSLTLLNAVHTKWVVLLRSLDDKDFDRTYFHPEHQTSFTLREVAGSYAWHCNHHIAHIQQALNAKGNY